MNETPLYQEVKRKLGDARVVKEWGNADTWLGIYLTSEKRPYLLCFLDEKGFDALGTYSVGFQESKIIWFAERIARIAKMKEIEYGDK